MKLTLRKCDWIEDWYVIERAEHDGREWVERTGPNTQSLRRSARIGDADIEGTAAEMLAIAVAIKAGHSESFKRCAAKRVNDGYLMFSPRNSENFPLVPHEDAKAIAVEIMEKLQNASA